MALIDDIKLSQIVKNTVSKIGVSNKKLVFSDLELEVIILSPYNYVDIVTNDFAKTYLNTMKIFQNEMGYFDKSLKVLNSTTEKRIFTLYNKINIIGNDLSLEKKIISLPVKFISGGDNKLSLQKTFNLLNHFPLLRIYSNNYLRHCSHKNFEEENLTEKQSFIDLCVIHLENNKNRVNSKIN